MNKLTKLRLKVISILFIFIIFIVCYNKYFYSDEKVQTIDTTQVVTELIKYDINTYFSKNFPKSKISAREIARVCIKYELEPIFVLSMAHVESHYGTTGRATKTNSIFNVGAWDDRTLNYYSTPDSSIEPYAKLLIENYLSNGKTVNDLLKPGGFKNIWGYRYASSKDYEYKIKWLMKYIKDRSNIKEINEYYKMVKKV